VWREARNDLLDYGQSGGHLPLRQAITEYLRISRSVKVEVEQVMITAGTQQSLDLCAQLLADAGDTAWVEDPCYWGARRVFQARELKLRPITVDSDGMALDDADLATKPRLIYVTPSHQYPTGAVMSLARRRELLEVAVRKDAWILEDDYDSEFRYTGRPLAALQGLDNDDRVLYMGTFSKVLYPGIKVGYLVVPPALIPPSAARCMTAAPGQLTVQATLTDFITHGHFTTHVRKIRQTYGARRELLRRMLAQTMPASVTISKEESGLHLVVELPDQRGRRGAGAARGGDGYFGESAVHLLPQAASAARPAGRLRLLHAGTDHRLRPPAGRHHRSGGASMKNMPWRDFTAWWPASAWSASDWARRFR
jgi:GntR family transcriptional regulator/MocR family aminotransferase